MLDLTIFSAMEFEQSILADAPDVAGPVNALIISGIERILDKALVGPLTQISPSSPSNAFVMSSFNRKTR